MPALGAGAKPVQLGLPGEQVGYGLPPRVMGVSGVMEAANIRVAKTARMVLFITITPPVPKHRSIISSKSLEVKSCDFIPDFGI